jgi:hypothetical protein
MVTYETEQRIEAYACVSVTGTRPFILRLLFEFIRPFQAHTLVELPEVEAQETLCSCTVAILRIQTRELHPAATRA